MSAVASAVLASAVIGGVVASKNASKAAKAQEEAARLAATTTTGEADKQRDFQLHQYEQNRADMAPWRDAGLNALGQLKSGVQAGNEFSRPFTMADFQADPGYAFRQQEGMKAVNASAAARGGALGGGAVRAAARFGSDMASQEYGNAWNRWNSDITSRFNRLSSLAGTSQTATRDVAQQGTTLAGNLASQGMSAVGNANDYMTQAANARASGYVGTANAVNSTMGTMGNMMMNEYYNPRRPAGNSGGSGGFTMPTSYSTPDRGSYNEFGYDGP